MVNWGKMFTCASLWRCLDMAWIMSSFEIWCSMFVILIAANLLSFSSSKLDSVLIDDLDSMEHGLETGVQGWHKLESFINLRCRMFCGWFNCVLLRNLCSFDLNIDVMEIGERLSIVGLVAALRESTLVDNIFLLFVTESIFFSNWSGPRRLS